MPARFNVSPSSLSSPQLGNFRLLQDIHCSLHTPRPDLSLSHVVAEARVMRPDAVESGRFNRSFASDGTREVIILCQDSRANKRYGF